MKKTIQRLVAIGFLLAGATQVLAHPSPEMGSQVYGDKQLSDILFTRTNVSVLSKENGIPLTCTVGMDVLNIMQIDATKETYTVDLYVWVSWMDTRMVFEGEDFGTERVTLPWNDVVSSHMFWNPELEFANIVDTRIMAQNLDIDSDGKCTITYRLIGTFRFTDAKRAFRRFPFERQELAIALESFRWDHDSLVFEFEKEQEEWNEQKLEDLNPVAWRVTAIRSFTEEKSYIGDPAPFSRAVTTIAIKRESGYYLWKVCLPLFILACIAMSAPWVCHKELPARLAVSLTTLVAINTYTLLVNAELPRFSYLTLLDKWMLLGFVISGVGALATVSVSFCSKRNMMFCDVVNYHLRWILPVIYFGMSLWFIISM